MLGEQIGNRKRSETSHSSQWLNLKLTLCLCLGICMCRTMCPTFREPSICFLLLSIAKSNNTKYNGISIQNTTIQPRPRRGRKSTRGIKLSLGISYFVPNIGRYTLNRHGSRYYILTTYVLVQSRSPNFKLPRPN